jgi:endogenous inhibitor of DNA gyrase (YacG/DUF329 family)
MITNHTCPICHKALKLSIQKQNQKPDFFPFCSERCRLIDLGAWLDAGYKVVSSIQSQESDLPANVNIPESNVR